jgi:hypothetical protein
MGGPAPNNDELSFVNGALVEGREIIDINKLTLSPRSISGFRGS